MKIKKFQKKTLINVVKYKLLNQINNPIDLKKFKFNDLKVISDELRHKTINTVSTESFVQLYNNNFNKGMMKEEFIKLNKVRGYCNDQIKKIGITYSNIVQLIDYDFTRVKYNWKDV